MDKCPAAEEGREIYLQKPKLWIKASEIPAILKNEAGLEAIQFFLRFKRYGLPFSGGWAEQPERLIEIIDILDPVDSIYHPPII